MNPDAAEWKAIRASAPLIDRLNECRKRLYSAMPDDMMLNVTLTDAIEVIELWNRERVRFQTGLALPLLRNRNVPSRRLPAPV